MSLEYVVIVTSGAEQRVYFVQELKRMSRNSIKGRLFESSRERIQVLNKRCTLFERSREGSLRGGSIVYSVLEKDYWSPKLANEGEDHGYISERQYLYWSQKHKWAISYQYGGSLFLTSCQTHTLILT